MTEGRERCGIEVVVYPENRSLKINVNCSSISVRDLLKVLEEFGFPMDYYVVAAEGRILSQEESIQAGARVLLLPLVMGGE
ncbi:MAG: hypothetical protein QXZ60_04910 [Sulfolobales archaeon]